MAKVKVFITLKEGILDPQGQTVAKALENLGYQGVQDVRIGKYIVIEMDEEKEEEIEKQVKSMCDRLLANPVIEDYFFEIED